MMRAQTDVTPPGIIDSLSAGFGAVAQKPALLLFPVFLDLFLWLGPRLSITPIAPDIAGQLGALAGETSDNSATLFIQNMTEILGSYNLFSALSTWPLGVPSLLAGNDAGAGPLGSPLMIPIHTVSGLLLSLLILVLAGLMLGSLYLGLIARWTAGSGMKLSAWSRAIWLQWARIVAFVSVTLIGAFLLSTSFFLVLEIAAMLAAPIAPLVFLIGAGMGMWGLFHLFFAAHGILLRGTGVRQSIGTSVRLVRRHRLSSVGLLLVAVLIGIGLTTVWNIPPSESWLRLIAITGNAFVNTGIATATFVFYRERTAEP